MADPRGKTFSTASDDAAVAAATTKGNAAQTAADNANTALAQIQDAGSDAENHAQKTASWTDTSSTVFDNGAKGYKTLAGASASAAATSETNAAADEQLAAAYRAALSYDNVDYSVNDATARDAIVGASTGETCHVWEEGLVYDYNGATWDFAYDANPVTVASYTGLANSYGGAGSERTLLEDGRQGRFGYYANWAAVQTAYVWAVGKSEVQAKAAGMVNDAANDANALWARIHHVGAFNVEWAGAVGDGSTDDATAIQASIDMAPDYSAIYLSNALTFGIGAGGLLLTSRNGLVFTGGGTLKMLAATAQTLPDGSNKVGIKLISCTRCGFDNVRVDGNDIVEIVIGITASVDCYVNNCEIFNFGTVPGIHTIDNDRTRISDNYVHDGGSGGQGIWLGNYGASLLERDVLVYGNTVIDLSATAIALASTGGRCYGNHAQVNGADGSGIIFGGANGFHSSDLAITNNRCVQNPYHGIQSDVTYTTDADLPRNITISNNICSENDGSGIYAINIIDSIITSNNCYNNNFDGVANAHGIQIGVRTLGVVISNNQCWDDRTGASRTQTKGVFADPQAATDLVKNVQIIGNTLRNNLSGGIHVSQVASTAEINQLVISGNICIDNGGTGIDLTAATQAQFTNTIVKDNICLNNTTEDMDIRIDDVILADNVFSTSTGIMQALDDSGTPSVKSRSLFDTGGTTAITDFDDGVIGQTIKIISSHSVTITDGAPIILAGGANFSMVASDTLTLTMFDSQVWQEVSRSVN